MDVIGETFQYHPKNLLINTKNACTYIYHKRKKTHKKTDKIDNFCEKTPKNRLFCVTFT